jgi:hypothetical protein
MVPEQRDESGDFYVLDFQTETGKRGPGSEDCDVIATNWTVTEWHFLKF